MWPMLLDLLPHFTRLVPLADKYFSGRGAEDKAHAAALAAIGDQLRAGLSAADEVNAGVQQALKAQGEQIAEVGVEATRARMAVESVEQRVEKLERSAATAMRIAVVALALLAGAVALLIVVLVKLKAR
jgi:hypothetical protein